MNMLCLKQGVMTDLCPFSDKDPGGLLLLPEKGDVADLNNTEVLAVTSTLLSVAAREVTGGCSPPLTPGDRCPHWPVPFTSPHLVTQRWWAPPPMASFTVWCGFVLGLFQVGPALPSLPWLLIPGSWGQSRASQ